MRNSVRPEPPGLDRAEGLSGSGEPRTAKCAALPPASAPASASLAESAPARRITRGASDGDDTRAAASASSGEADAIAAGCCDASVRGCDASVRELIAPALFARRRPAAPRDARSLSSDSTSAASATSSPAGVACSAAKPRASSAALTPSMTRRTPLRPSDRFTRMRNSVRPEPPGLDRAEGLPGSGEPRTAKCAALPPTSAPASAPASASLAESAPVRRITSGASCEVSSGPFDAAEAGSPASRRA